MSVLKEYKTLRPHMRRHAWSYVAGILCLALTSGSQIITPQLMRLAIDHLTSGSARLDYILNIAAGLMGVAALIALGRFGWRYFILGASRRIEADLRSELFSQFLRLQPSFYRESQIGDLMARSTNDMSAVRNASGMGLVALFDGVFMTVAILAIMFARNPRIAAVAVIPLPLITFLVLYVGRFVRGLYVRVQQGFSTLSQHAQEVFSGVRVVKSFVKETYFLGKFRAANEDYQRRNMRVVRVWGMLFPLVNFLAGITTLLLLRYGGEAVILGSLSPGEFVATLSYLEMLIWPMLGAGFTVELLQRGAASLQRINSVLATEPEIVSPPNGVSELGSTSISIRNLSFRFGDSEELALEDVSIEIPEGTILGILGRTGSGKSSLLRLLPRLDNPPRGTIFLGDVDILDYDLGALRLAFGAVPQDTFLFSASLEDNIGFGVDAIDEEKVRHVADISTISRDVEMLPNGWQTEVGERGITLSGGQKQRVAISRALAKDPRILVFDDALSAVDTETEEQILQTLLNERSGRTSIIVSHRVSTLSTADQIVVLEGGRVVQHGNHSSLMAEDGFYSEIARLQQLSHEDPNLTAMDPADEKGD